MVGSSYLALCFNHKITVMIIGRKEELATLASLNQSNESAFVAVYGRRRVGKTYLIREFFNDTFHFKLTGIANVELLQQLGNFHSAFIRHFPEFEDKPVAKDWFQAFQYLITALEADDSPKKILFLDELPWLDNTKSYFIAALEHFWNSWASARKDILLIVCGSSASWMINNLINNRGGLHNRVTHRLILEPFTLAECEAFFTYKSATYTRYQIVQLYMVLGGIPFYLNAVDIGKSAAQNINDFCFTPKGFLRKEFNNLYASLFKKADKHINVIEALSQKMQGVEREELLKLANLPNNGNTTKILTELEESNFITKYTAFGKNSRNTIYQLIDFYSLFYIRFIKNSDAKDKNFWLNSLDSPEIRTWSGYAFEQICFSHLDEIKKALGISGVQTNSSAWIGSNGTSKAQIDLVIDRRDQVINLCEAKFSINLFTIDKKYADELRTKIGVFKDATQTQKSVFLTLITTLGLTPNDYAQTLVQNTLTMNDLFQEK
jgi:uncharacterized protein